MTVLREEIDTLFTTFGAALLPNDTVRLCLCITIKRRAGLGSPDERSPVSTTEILG